MLESCRCVSLVCAICDAFLKLRLPMTTSDVVAAAEVILAKPLWNAPSMDPLYSIRPESSGRVGAGSTGPVRDLAVAVPAD